MKAATYELLPNETPKTLAIACGLGCGIFVSTVHSSKIDNLNVTDDF